MPFDGINPQVANEVSVILRARHILMRDGWCQGAWQSGANHCMVDALCVAHIELVGLKHQKWWKFVIHPVVRRAISRIKKGANIKTDLIVWNDTQGRSKSDVLFALKMGADWTSEQNLRMGVTARIRASVLSAFVSGRDDDARGIGDTASEIRDSEPLAPTNAKEMIDA